MHEDQCPMNNTTTLAPTPSPTPAGQADTDEVDLANVIAMLIGLVVMLWCLYEMCRQRKKWCVRAPPPPPGPPTAAPRSSQSRSESGCSGSSVEMSDLYL